MIYFILYFYQMQNFPLILFIEGIFTYNYSFITYYAIIYLSSIFISLVILVVPKVANTFGYTLLAILQFIAEMIP